MEGFQDREFLSILKRILCEFKKARKRELSDKYLRGELTKNIRNLDLEILVIYVSAIPWLECSGYISQIQDNEGEIGYRLDKRPGKLIRKLNKEIYK